MDIPKYIRCRTCGRYITTDDAIPGGYCSEECSLKFDRCINCGRYFPRGEGYRGEYCSKECSTHYMIKNVFDESRFGEERQYRYIADKSNLKETA